MKDLLAYLERIHPGYAGAVRGTGDSAFEFIEERIERPLPGVYRAFMLELGKEPGPILEGVTPACPKKWLFDHGTMSDVFPPRRFFYLLEDQSLVGDHWWLDLERPCGVDDYEVVTFPFEPTAFERRSRMYVSFREALFMAAARRIHLRRHPHRASFSQPSPDREPTSLARLEELLGRVGLTPLPQLTRCRIFEREDAAAGLYRYVDSDDFAFTVAFTQPKELRLLRLLLSEHTTMVEG